MNKFVKRFMPIFLSLFTIFVFLIVKESQDVAEFMIKYIGGPLNVMFSFMSSIFPFSLLELLMYMGILFVIVFIIFIIVNVFRFRFRAIGKGLYGFVCVVLFFIVTSLPLFVAGYYRKPLDLGLDIETITDADVRDAAAYYNAEFLTLSKKFNDDSFIEPTFNELEELIQDEYVRLLGDNDYFYGNTTEIKHVMFEEFFSTILAGVGGMYLPQFGEPNIFGGMQTQAMAKVMAHEYAHAQGVFTEWETNLTAYYVLLLSEDEFLRYSGYSFTIYKMNQAVADSYKLGTTESNYNTLYTQSFDLFTAINGFFSGLLPEDALNYHDVAEEGEKYSVTVKTLTALYLEFYK